MGQLSDNRQLRRAKISWPMGSADFIIEAYAATLAVDLWNKKTFLTVGQLTGDITINTTFEALEAGATLSIKLSADGTNRTYTPGVGFLNQVAIVVALNTSRVVTYEFDGTGFNLISNNLSS